MGWSLTTMANRSARSVLSKCALGEMNMERIGNECVDMPDGICEDEGPSTSKL